MGESAYCIQDVASSWAVSKVCRFQTGGGAHITALRDKICWQILLLPYADCAAHLISHTACRRKEGGTGKRRQNYGRDGPEISERSQGLGEGTDDLITAARENSNRSGVERTR